AEILRDSVANGASVGFMHWNGAADYERFWRDVAAGVASGQIILFAARNAEGIVGTAQLHLAAKPNQPHRAEIAKVLVHSRARRQGIGEALMRRAEAVARDKGRDLLVLDTDENGAARRLYNRLGWTELGTIPRFALMPDGADCGSTFFYKSLA
uniref:GNAT family N-acetyltransferase n=1 Tax=Bosea sp. (in: a-proteobacteria) TaxID=1871050 RepID=UPI00334290AF